MAVQYQLSSKSDEDIGVDDIGDKDLQKEQTKASTGLDFNDQNTDAQDG